MSYDTGVGQRTAVVTGCASAHGIGLATARRYAQEGWALAMIDRDEAVVGNAEALAAEYGVPTIGRAVDVCDRAAVFAFAADVAAADLPAVGAIANIAGVASPAAFLDLTPAEWQRVLDVNLTGSFYVCQAFIPQLIEGGYGRIVNMSSVTAQHGGGVFSKTAYAAAKAGVIGLTRGLAREFAAHGITANAVCPGAVDTDIRVGSTADQEAALAASVPLRRVATRDEIAALYVFLSSGDAGYITGTTQSINGGSYIY
ncbi:MAG: SDR family oxidoreductase [Austwickia sp.]|nr:SDR family oxidoreductase [Austwickia sp.]MCO5307864.1 SDR family oxidoreductase [Austwickia sp.]